MKKQKNDLNKHLNLRLDDIRNSTEFNELENQYAYASGFLMACALIVNDYDWSDNWLSIVKNEYLQKRYAIHETQDIYEDTPFD